MRIVAGKRYYALVASLPRLPHFEQAEYLPISREELLSRLRMLDPLHWRQLEAAIELLRWQKQPRERSDAAIASQYAAAMATITDPNLRELVTYWMGQRLVVMSLRLKALGESLSFETPWALLPLHGKLARHWDDADLGVVALFPWVNQARELIEAQDAMSLERLLIGAVWRRINEIDNRSAFGFERVVSFVFKWEHTKRWLSYDAVAAKQRFQQLMTEVVGDQQLFA